MTEEWRPFPCRVGEYEVSNFGRVRSLERRVPCGGLKPDGTARTRIVRPRILPQTLNGRGYPLVKVGPEPSRQTLVHRLVCLVFNGEPPFPSAICRHANDDRMDNRAENLLWGTVADNTADARLNGHLAIGERVNTAKLNADQVRAIRAAVASGSPKVSVARRFGVSGCAIGDIIKGRSWRHITTTDASQVPGSAKTPSPKAP